jgi:hypothetical protein
VLATGTAIVFAAAGSPALWTVCAARRLTAQQLRRSSANRAQTGVGVHSRPRRPLGQKPELAPAREETFDAVTVTGDGARR